MHELRGNRAIDSTTDGADDLPLFPTYIPDPRDLLTNESFLRMNGESQDVGFSSYVELRGTITIVQFARHFVISKTNREITSFPRRVWVTSGWNCIPQKGLVLWAIAAYGAVVVFPITWKSVGICDS
jgi:hypothetical protein